MISPRITNYYLEKGLSFLVFVMPSNRVKCHLRGGCRKPQWWFACANRKTLNSKWDINVHCQFPCSRAPARGEQLTVYRRMYSRRRFPPVATSLLHRPSLCCRSVRSHDLSEIHDSSPGSSAETNIVNRIYPPYALMGTTVHVSSYYENIKNVRNRGKLIGKYAIAISIDPVLFPKEVDL